MARYAGVSPFLAAEIGHHLDRRERGPGGLPGLPAPPAAPPGQPIGGAATLPAGLSGCSWGD